MSGGHPGSDARATCGEAPAPGDPPPAPGSLPDEDTLFRDAFRYAPIGMAVVGAGGHILRTNPAFRRLLGYAEGELEQTTLLALTHPDDRESCADAVRAMKGDGGRLFFPQKRYLRKDGTLVWASVHGSFRLDETGAPVFGLVQLEDISERVAYERELARTNTRLEHAQRIAQVGSFEVDLETDQVAWSAELYRIYGLAPDSFRPTFESYLERVHPRDRERIHERIAPLRDGVWDDTRPLVLQHRIVRPDGTLREVTTEGRIERNAHGKPIRLVGTTQDVTAREAAKRALERQVRQEDALADLGREALQNEDITAVLQRGVERAVAMVGAGFGRVAELLPGGESVIVRASVGWPEAADGPNVLAVAEDGPTQEALERRAPAVREAEGRDGPAGTTVPILGPHGPFGVLSVHFHDARIASPEDTRFLQSVAVLLATAIERKQTEKALVQREQQLFAAQKMEAIARLAGGVAHDFNNLLLVISGFAGLLERQLREDDPRRREVDAITEAAERASRLTRQLLAFGRKQVLQPQALDINEAITDMRRMLERMLGEDVRIDIDLDPDLGRAEVDPGQLEQVLLNLAVNARDALPQGGHLRIATRNVDLDADLARTFHGLEAGEHVLLSVEDDGMGMDAATQSQVFEPFFTTKTRDHGSGLGLSTVYGIVKQSGGDITLHSRLGRGTRVDVYLPRVHVSAPGQQPRRAPQAARGGTETLLVVEDEEAVRSLAARMLGEYGYTVLTAADGKAALQVLRGRDAPIDLLLTDVVMPTMGGPDLARHTRTLYPEMPILFVSGYADQRERLADVLDEGAAFLRKPFSPAELAQAVRDLLDR